MFSKQKRFPEGGKDYVPGPGEYQVNVDDIGRHKKYGFLNQANRFQEDVVFDPAGPNEYYEHQYQSSTTTTSTTSKASDDNNQRKKSLMQLDIQQFMAMQKEIEILQAKNKKQNISIQSLEQEKSDTKALLLQKDLELREQRAKNATLSKTIQSQEVSNKATQLQKKIDQLEQELTSKEQTIQEHVNTITHMIQTQQELKSVEARLSAQLVAAETHAKDQEVQLKHEIECITSKLETQRGLLTASEKRLQQQTERVNTLETQLHDQQRAKEDAEALIAHLRHRFDTYRQWIDGTVVPHLRQQRQEAQQQQVVELRRVEHELVEAKKFINRQAQHIACLKSDVHWLNAQNKQVSLLVVAMGREHKEQWVWNKDWYDGRVVLPSVSKPQRKSTTIKRRPIIKKVVEEDDYSSDTISFSSRSSFSNDEQDETIDMLNDSGFGILADEKH